MNTAPEVLALIETWESLSSALHREGIDVESINAEERTAALEMWLGDRGRFEVSHSAEPVGDEEALRRLISQFAPTHVREVAVFCPQCGSGDLVELCTATTYHTLRAVRLGFRGGRTISDRAQCDDPSIGDGDCWRCRECDFETESDLDLLQVALIGGPVQAQVTIDNGVRVELLEWISDRGKNSCLARVDLYCPSSPSAWLRVVDDVADCFRLPLAEGDSDLYKEVLMRRTAMEVKSVIVELETEGLVDTGGAEKWSLDIPDRMGEIEKKLAIYEGSLDEQRKK